MCSKLRSANFIHNSITKCFNKTLNANKSCTKYHFKINSTIFISVI